jgi:hypothetical protein
LPSAIVSQLSDSRDVVFANGTPVAGDFINMHATARLVLSRDLQTIYRRGGRAFARQ